MASGTDDEVTLRANREGFLKFQLRPRRLTDVSKVDMSIELFGAKWDTPIVIAPTGGNKAHHPTGKSPSPRPPAWETICRSSRGGRGGGRPYGGQKPGNLLSAPAHGYQTVLELP